LMNTTWAYFLEFGQGHQKHKLLVDIHPPNPLEPNYLNKCGKFGHVLSLKLGKFPPFFLHKHVQGCHL
jgi:hypothetical protein